MTRIECFDALHEVVHDPIDGTFYGDGVAHLLGPDHKPGDFIAAVSPGSPNKRTETVLLRIEDNKDGKPQTGPIHTRERLVGYILPNPADQEMIKNQRDTASLLGHA